MNNEAPGTQGQWLKGVVIAGSNDRIVSDDNEDNVCLQTGEEFSTEFYRDRFGLRRLPVTTDADNHQPNRLGLDYSQNYQVVYDDLARVVGLRRRDSDSNSDLSDFVTTPSYIAEPESKAYPNNLSKFQWEHGGIGQRSGNFAEEIYLDQISSGPMASPIYAVESLQSCHPHPSTFSDASCFKKIKFLCSFGGRILPRPNDGKLRYVGGETRIISLRKNITWKQLMEKTCAIWNVTHITKYQLPGEDLDALISVCSDEDLNHMIEEYEELERIGGSQRLRIFLISSSESENPNSIEAKVSLPGDVDYQYVVAVNGVLEPSPRKSSSGQGLVNQTSQFGNTSDFNSPILFKESDASAFAWDVKDCSLMSPRLGGLLNKASSQLLTALQVPGKSFNQSPPSPISRIRAQPKDHQISNIELIMDQPCNVGNEGLVPFVKERTQCENSLYKDDAHYVDPAAYYKNLAQGSRFLNHHHNNQHIVEVDQPENLIDDVQCHVRRNSENFVSSATCGQGDMMFERPPRPNEGSFRLVKNLSHHEASSLVISVSNDRDRERPPCRLLHALSDPLLQKRDERFEDQLQPSLTVKGNKSPLIQVSSSSRERPLQEGEVIDEKNLVAEHQFLPSFGKIGSFKGISSPNQGSLQLADNDNTCSGEIGRFGGNIEVTSHENVLHIKDLEGIDYKQVGCQSSVELQRSECRLLASSLQSESTRNLKEQPHGLLQDLAASELMIRSQNSTMYQQVTVSTTDNSKSSHLGSSDLQFIDSLTDIESTLLVTNTYKGSASRGKIFLPDKNPANCPHQKNDKIVCDQDYFVRYNIELSDQSRSSVTSQEIKQLNAAAIVEGPAGSISSGVDVDEEDESEAVFRKKEEIESGCSVSQNEIIKNVDIEELQELGSGTFGTVYHGKWRGTDVAIKRIKSSCFSGRLSEQERLKRDFWREAKILSTLHHPNVVAFYGVVPDGPGGTLATLTEFMVHGSLRNVLLKKEKVLDRRKRLMIAMDAAFGMEYLHFKNIVHFDLKCDNLLVNLGDPERPVCKVADFGLSRIKHNTLVSGGVRGTLPWMAPELLDGNSSGVSEKVDIFSFGIAMWEILTGEEPYASMHCGAIIGGIVNNTLRPPIPKRCDSEWKRLMEECWSPDPAARPSFTDITHRFRLMQAALPKKKPCPAT
ncbi:uncharacterized protein LOC129308082 isoform X2 [Prosopis cineraria]|uniref:uncharacterized protein LOC129308082 isoform X2 n=1 Tax=Prosopis cineraria TaxID=364024 RepID=UPI00240F1EC8|nr:uncharacterized protein LOC129308082 isoform X2 [Prosopis cineraria]